MARKNDPKTEKKWYYPSLERSIPDEQKCQLKTKAQNKRPWEISTGLHTVKKVVWPKASARLEQGKLRKAIPRMIVQICRSLPSLD